MGDKMNISNDIIELIANKLDVDVSNVNYANAKPSQVVIAILMSLAIFGIVVYAQYRTLALYILYGITAFVVTGLLVTMVSGGVPVLRFKLGVTYATISVWRIVLMILTTIPEVYIMVKMDSYIMAAIWAVASLYQLTLAIKFRKELDAVGKAFYSKVISDLLDIHEAKQPINANVVKNVIDQIDINEVFSFIYNMKNGNIMSINKQVAANQPSWESLNSFINQLSQINHVMISKTRPE